MNRLIFATVLTAVAFAARAAAPTAPQEQKPGEKLLAVRCLAFSPGGTWLAVGGGSDGTGVSKPRYVGDGFVRVYSVRGVLGNVKKDLAGALHQTNFTNFVGLVGFVDEGTVATVSQERKQTVGSAPPYDGVRVTRFAVPGGKELKRIPLGDCLNGPPSMGYHPSSDQVSYWSNTLTVGGSVLAKLGGGKAGKGGGKGLPAGEATRAPNYRLDQGPGAAHRYFSPDGKALLTCPPFHEPGKKGIGPASSVVTDSLLRLHETTTGKVTAAFDPDGAFVACAAFAPDGQRLVLACHNQRVYVLTGDLKRVVRVVPVGAACAAVAVAPDGQSFAAATAADTMKVYEIGSGKVRHSLEGIKEGVNCLAFSPDGALLAVGCGDAGQFGRPVGPGSVRLFDARTGKLLVTLN